MSVLAEPATKNRISNCYLLVLEAIYNVELGKNKFSVKITNTWTSNYLKKSNINLQEKLPDCGIIVCLYKRKK